MSIEAKELKLELRGLITLSKKADMRKQKLRYHLDKIQVRKHPLSTNCVENVVSLPSALDIRNEDSFKWVSFVVQSYIIYGLSFLLQVLTSFIAKGSPYTFVAILGYLTSQSL